MGDMPPPFRDEVIRKRSLLTPEPVPGPMLVTIKEMFVARSALVTTLGYHQPITEGKTSDRDSRSISDDFDQNRVRKMSDDIGEVLIPTSV